MEILDLLPQANRVVTQLKVISKKNLLERLSDIASEHIGLKNITILQALLSREEMGSTGVGGGIAIPHARLPNISKIYGLFVQLEQPIDFDAIDNHPIDLVFLLMAPEDSNLDHLKALAKVARFFKDHSLCERLRHLRDKHEIYDLLVKEAESKAA